MRVNNARVSAAPSAEPVTTAEVKANSRVTSTAEDSLIDTFIQTAREHCEEVSYWAFITRTLVSKLECWPCDDCIELLYPPLQSVTSIVYTDSAGGSHTFDSSNYIVDTHSIPGRIILKYGMVWPTETLQNGPAITITYVTGFGDAADDVPAKYKAAIKAYASAYFENREALVAGAGLTLIELPFVEEWLLSDRAY